MPAVCPALAGPREHDREHTDGDTGVQPSGSLRSGDRGSQSIARVTTLSSQTLGAPPILVRREKRHHFWASLWDPHLSGDRAGNTITESGSQYQPGARRAPEIGRNFPEGPRALLPLSPKGCSKPGADSTHLIFQLHSPEMEGQGNIRSQLSLRWGMRSLN